MSYETVGGTYFATPKTYADTQDVAFLVDAQGRLITTQSGVAPLGGGITWGALTAVAMTGASKVLVAANPARKAIVIMNPVGNAQISYDLSGGTVTLVGGIPLLAAAKDSYTGAACPVGAITVIGTNLQSIKKAPDVGIQFSPGPGSENDTRALTALLTDSFTNQKVIKATQDTYYITSPIVISVAESMTGGVGLDGRGCKIISGLPPGTNQPLITVEVASGVQLRYVQFRNFTILGSLTGVNGTTGETSGLRLSCQNNPGNLWSFVLDNVNVVGVNTRGIDISGNVFEGTIENCWAEQCGTDGVYIENSNGGVASAIHWKGGGARQNGHYGLDIEGGAYDVNVSDCYFVLNGYSGIGAANGITGVHHCGFENNGNNSAVAPYGINMAGFGNIRDCTFSTGGSQLVGIRCFLVPGGVLNIDGCGFQYYGGGGDPTTPMAFTGTGVVACNVPVAAISASATVTVVEHGPRTPTPVIYTGSQTLNFIDIGHDTLMNNGSSANLTVPPNSTTAFPIGTKIPVKRLNALVTFVAGSGVTFVPATGLTIAAINKAATLTKTATDTWFLEGTS